MKKIMFLVFAASMIVGNVCAQDDARERLQLGVKVGLNYANVYDVQGQDFNADAKLGLVVGGFLSIPIGKYLGFQPELLFSQKGFQGTGSILGSPYEFTRTTNYIDIPLMVQLKPSSMLTVVVGPQYSFLIKQKDTFTNSILSTQQEQEFAHDNIRKNTLCFLGGFDVNVSTVVIGARAGWDFLNNNGDGTSETPRYKNVWTQLTVGLKF